MEWANKSSSLERRKHKNCSDACEEDGTDNAVKIFSWQRRKQTDIQIKNNTEKGRWHDKSID